MTKILYVEDNEDNAYMLKMRLEIEGFDVVLAANGFAGIELAASASPDLILMDLNLPGIDGWEAARRLKEDARTATIPIIALTAHAMAGDREKALAAGCDDFDTKPVDFDPLLAKIRTVLTQRPGVVNY